MSDDENPFESLVQLEGEGAAAEWVPIDSVHPWPGNPRKNAHVVPEIARSIERFGWGRPLIARRENGELVVGHTAYEAAKSLGLHTVPVRFVDLSEHDAHALAIADNKLGELAEWDERMLLAQVKELEEAGLDVADMGLDEDDMKHLEELGAGGAEGEKPAAGPSLAERFLVPPFSVLDARQGYWQERKRQWLAIGIQSEVGRGGNLLNMSPQILETQANGGTYDEAKKKAAKKATPGGGGSGPKNVYTKKAAKPGHLTYATGAERTDDVSKRILSVGAKKPVASMHGETPTMHGGYGPVSHEIEDRGGGTSIFDPVLCEIAYRWFSPPTGKVLDPFAGGSVRGVVAGRLGLNYTGIELRGEQVAANRDQGARLLEGAGVSQGAKDVVDHQALTPVEKYGEIYAKRDDLYVFNGARGGKARSARRFLLGAPGCVVTGSRLSPMISRVARVAKALGIPCRVHLAGSKELSVEEADAQAHGAELVKHKVNYLNALRSKAEKDADALGWRYVPFGLECDEYLGDTAAQAHNLPDDMKRLVVVVGSGVSLAGILRGMDEVGLTTPVLGVTIGADPTETLDKHYPGWKDRVKLVPSGLPYETAAQAFTWNGIALDPYYEAKAVPFLEPGDCFWIVACRATVSPEAQVAKGSARWIEGDSTNAEKLAPGEYDMVFSCPPYADLEVYSDDPRDLSTFAYDDFVAAYRAIIAGAVRMLKKDRFACFVVGEVREKKGGGFYRGFVVDTINAFEDAGARLYNEAILVTAVGSLPLRVGGQFSGSRKLGKTHQNVLVFCKGDPKKAAEACGHLDVALPEAAAIEGGTA